MYFAAASERIPRPRVRWACWRTDNCRPAFELEEEGTAGIAFLAWARRRFCAVRLVPCPGGDGLPAFLRAGAAFFCLFIAPF